MTIPCLPSLKADSSISPDRGKWSSGTQANLEGVRDSLEIATSYKSSINSIPDLWARPTLFERVLANSTHYLHKKYLAEWRGILAILALRVMRNYSGIEVKTVLIPDGSKIRTGDPVLKRIISCMLPNEYKAFSDPTVDSGFTKMQVITMGNKQPLAIVWPTLLICPAVELQQNYKNHISWWVNDIEDPIPSLNEKEKEVLYKWLQDLIDDINLKISEGTSYRNKLVNLVGWLGDFRNELKVENQVVENYRPGKSLNITGFCEKLGRAYTLELDSERIIASSHVLLANRNKTPNVRNLLVVTSDLDSQWSRAASEIVVAGTASLDTLKIKGTETLLCRDKIGDTNLVACNAELRTGDDFFTKQICLINNGKSIFPNAYKNIVFSYGGTLVNALMPLSKELLDYLPPEDLAKNINITTKDGDIEVELRLPVSGYDSDHNTITVRKTYHAEPITSKRKEIIHFNDWPMIQIWPNFVMKKGEEYKWQHYYSFYHKIVYNTFKARPYWPEEEEFEGEGIEIEARELTGGEIVLGRKFPQTYVCEYHNEADGKDVMVGVILLKPPVRPLEFNSSARKVTIGIDFGTTNTVAYMAVDGKDKPSLIRLDNYDDEKEMLRKRGNQRALLYDVTYIIATGDDSVEFRETARRNFIALTDQPAKGYNFIRSMFKTHDSRPTSKANYPLLKGIIYYMDEADSIMKDKGEISLQTDEMKWDARAAANKESLIGFLRELGMQCMAEAIKEGATEIDWVFSYPKSFARNMIGDLEGVWKERLINTFHDISPLSKEGYEKRTESEAMADYFFDSMDAKPESGIVCMDIGGGSTDIAIWQGNENQLRYQASLRFAGKNIINDQLFKYRAFLGELNNGNSSFESLLAQAGSQTNRKDFDLVIETLLQYYEADIIEGLGINGNNEGSNLDYLVRNVAFAIAGIFFYTGLVIGYLRVSGKYDEYDYLPECFVGGNGSKMLDWVAKCSFDSSKPVKDIFQYCLMEGVQEGQDLEYREDNGLPIDERARGDYEYVLDIQKSAAPKEEVAYGLVCRHVMDQNPQAKQPAERKPGGFARFRPMDKRVPSSTIGDIVAGEDFKTKMRSNGRATEILEEEDFLNELRVNKDLRVFKQFLKRFNYEAGGLRLPEIVLEEGDWSTLCKKVNQELADKQREYKGSMDNVTKEPLFIVILKKAMDMLPVTAKGSR